MAKISEYIIALAATAAILFLVWFFSDIVIYIVVAAILAIIAKPLVSLIRRVNVGGFVAPKWLAALLTLITIWAVILLVFMIFVPLFFNKLNELSSINIVDVVASLTNPISNLDHWVAETFSLNAEDYSLAGSISTQIGSILDLGFVNRMVASVASTIVGVVVSVFSISFMTFFFLKEENLFRDMVVAVFPERHELKVLNVMESVTKLLIRYFRGIVTESSIMTVIVTTGLTIFGLGLENALLIGFFTGVLNVIPYIGPLIGICVGIFLGAAGAGAADLSVIYIICTVAATILTAQLIDNILLQPILYAKTAKAHPLEIFIVILIAGSIAGVVGMLLAIPSYNVLRVFAKEFFNKFSVVQKLTSKI